MANAQPLGIGHFDQRGNACLKLHLCGVRHDPPGVEFEAIIDTGFTGFIQLPLSHAMSLSLPLEGTNVVTLADESKLVMLTAMVDATLLGRTESGVALLSTSSDSILVGMDFLRRFRRALVVSKAVGVVLMDEEPIEEAQKKLAEKLRQNETDT